MTTWVPKLLSSRWTERQETPSDSELVIRTLYEITSDYRQRFPDQVRRLLDLGCRRFDMEVGILSVIEGQRYRILHHVSAPRFGLEEGQAFALDSTLCGLTVRAGGAVGFEDLAKSRAAGHSAAAEGGVAAYIGTPVMTEQKLWGTVSFLSLEPRPRRFNMADVDSLQLMASWVSTEVQRRNAEQALREAKQQLERISRTDPLTGLVNRRALEQRLEELQAQGAGLVALLVDADDFKAVNENHGHAGGDLVLQAIADRTREQVSPGDLVARIGGDEFMVLLQDTALSVAAATAERIRAAVCGAPVRTPNGVCQPQVSLGVVPVDAEANTVTDILKRASRLLKDAKLEGKNTVAVAPAG